MFNYKNFNVKLQCKIVQFNLEQMLYHDLLCTPLFFLAVGVEN